MKIIYQNGDSPEIITPAPKYLMDMSGTETEKLTQIAKQILPAGTQFQIVEDNYMPPAGNATLADVKAEAGRRILEKLPAWKQSNLIAREAELIATEGGHLRDSNGVKLPARDLTNDEVGELVHIKTLWDWVKSVRSASGVIEQSPPPIDQLKTDNRWPA